MTQNKRLDYLLRYLLAERKVYADIHVPDDLSEKQKLLRSLMNVRPPVPASAEFLAVQDAYLQERLSERDVTRLEDLKPAQAGLYLWQGDITTLAVDAIVNAANSQMLGCFAPCHGCIDNAIHTYAGVQLRLECAEIMRKQRHEESTGKAKITKGYNLPCRYVLHTVGPIIYGAPPLPGSPIQANASRSILRILSPSMVSAICTPAGSTRLTALKNIGRIGAGISLSTAT